MPVSSKLWRIAPSKRPMVGKFCTPEKPMAFSSARNCGIRTKGSVPLTPASTGVCFTTGSTSKRHLLDDLVGVAIGEQARRRAAPGHAVAAGIVDDDEVDAAGFLAFGREAGAGAAADDRLAACHHVAEFFEDFVARAMARHGEPSARAISRKAATAAAANSGSLMWSGRRIEPAPVGLTHRRLQRLEQRRVGLRILRRRRPSMSSAETPFSGMRNRTGPSQALSFSAIHSPIAGTPRASCASA